MPKVKKPWHQGTYHVRSRRLVAQAWANPETRCWRCGRTLQEHGPQRNGRPPRWTAGHVQDSTPGGLLLAEVSTCNARAGRLLRAQRERQRKRAVVRTSLTW